MTPKDHGDHKINTPNTDRSTKDHEIKTPLRDHIPNTI